MQREVELKKQNQVNDEMQKLRTLNEQLMKQLELSNKNNNKPDTPRSVKRIDKDLPKNANA
jgi:hypothetical protein